MCVAVGCADLHVACTGNHVSKIDCVHDYGDHAKDVSLYTYFCHKK